MRVNLAMVFSDEKDSIFVEKSVDEAKIPVF